MNAYTLPGLTPGEAARARTLDTAAFAVLRDAGLLMTDLHGDDAYEQILQALQARRTPERYTSTTLSVLACAKVKVLWQPRFDRLLAGATDEDDVILRLAANKILRRLQFLAQVPHPNLTLSGDWAEAGVYWTHLGVYPAHFSGPHGFVHLFGRLDAEQVMVVHHDKPPHALETFRRDEGRHNPHAKEAWRRLAVYFEQLAISQ